MLFNSFPFVFLFLPIALFGFYAAARINTHVARLWLIFMSFAFYAWWHPAFAMLLVISIGFNYSCGLAISSLRNKSSQSYVLIGAISANLLALFYYKYAFALTSWMVTLGLGSHAVATGVLLPLGISFFTFTQIGFLLDSKEAVVRDKSFVNYTLFVTFFPHLIAGPILHHKEIMPQFADRSVYRFQGENFARGYCLFIIGMLKKVLIADSLAPFANSGFAIPGSLHMFAAWGTALCYSIQLYFDFSGYSDMAIGIAKMFNITFPFNFNSPYKADSIIDFWSRWHMSLTRYLNLYLYNPLAARATRKLAARGLPITRRALAKPLPFTKTIVGPIFFTMVLAGIWHGAGLQFLIFGLLHGIYLVCNHTWRTYGPKATATASGGPNSIVTHLFFVALTYVAVLVGQVFFRSASTHDAFALLRAMVGVNGVGANLPVPYWLVARIGTVGLWLRLHGAVSIVGPLQNGAQAIETIAEMAVAYAIIWCLPNSQTIVGLTEPLKRVTTKPATSLATRRLKMELNVRWGLGMGVLTAIALLEIGAKSEFLYFQF